MWKSFSNRLLLFNIKSFQTLKIKIQFFISLKSYQQKPKTEAEATEATEAHREQQTM